MSIEEKLEIAKQYIADNESIKALKILKSLIHLKMDAFLKEKIYFEIGKIYMILNENKKSTIYLSKISKKNPVYNLAIELLLKNYKILNLPNKQIDFIRKNKKFPITEQMIIDLVEDIIDSNNFLMCFKFVNNYRNKLNDFSKILNQIYKSLTKYIQYLNRNHKYNKVIELFNNINRYIPKTEKKIKNILLNEYEIAQNKICLKSYPRIMNLILTTRCNLKCIMCSEKEHNNEYNLSNKGIKDLVEVMPYLEKLILRGGEVFLHDKIVYILEQAKKYKVDIEIVTNGLLLTEKIINLLLDVVTELTFSIDSVNKNTYEKIRSGANFDRLLKNIELFNNLNKGKNYKVNTRLTMVVMKSNYREIENVIKFAGEHNFKEVYLLPVRGRQAEKEELIFSNGFNKSIISELNDKKVSFENIAKKFCVKLYNTLPKKKTFFNDCLIDNASQKSFLKDNLNLSNKKQITKHSAKYCFAPWKQMYLLNTNGMPTCICKLLFTEHFNKKNLIMSMWNNKIMQYYRYKIVTKKYRDICSNDCHDEHIRFL